MRKFRFLGIVAAVLFVVALPAMAATTVGIAGEVTYGAITNGTVAGDGWVNAYMNITGTLDANNSIELALQGTNMPTILGTVAGRARQTLKPEARLARWLPPISPTSS